MKVYKVVTDTLDTSGEHRFYSAVIERDKGGLQYQLGEKIVLKDSPMMVFSSGPHARTFACCIGSYYHITPILECECDDVETPVRLMDVEEVKKGNIKRFWKIVNSYRWEPYNRLMQLSKGRKGIYTIMPPRGTLLTHELTPLRICSPDEFNGQES